jgi:hypothetical protein
MEFALFSGLFVCFVLRAELGKHFYILACIGCITVTFVLHIWRGRFKAQICCSQMERGLIRVKYRWPHFGRNIRATFSRHQHLHCKVPGDMEDVELV